MYYMITVHIPGTTHPCHNRARTFPFCPVAAVLVTYLVQRNLRTQRLEEIAATAKPVLLVLLPLFGWAGYAWLPRVGHQKG